MLSEAVEIFRSTRRAECTQRAFMLTAVDVPNELAREGEFFVIRVEPHLAEEARAQLLRYQEELRPPPPPPPPPVLHRDAWVGCVLYGVVLLGIAYAVGTGLWGLGAFDAGELDAALVRHGQWWRALTALTLHLDAAHLGANLAAGAWFGYLAGRLLGPGSAWALIVTGAGGANLLEGLIAPPGHRSVGASTAVFTALGLLAVRSWLDGYAQRQRWALRVSPLVAGIVLLAWLGSAGEHTDVFGHLSGFVVGGLLGALSARGTLGQLLERVPQWLAGAWALGLVGLAWLGALR